MCVHSALSHRQLRPANNSEGTIFFLVLQWTLTLYFLAVDRESPPCSISSVLNAVIVMMILRVYAMWNRSKIILGVLLLIFIPLNILIFVLTGVLNNPNTYLSSMCENLLDGREYGCNHHPSFALVNVISLYGRSACNQSYSTPSPLWTYELPNFLFSALLLILALIQTLKQSMEMYKATKQWQPNRYMKQLVKDGIIYFALCVIRLLYHFLCHVY